MVSNYKGYMSCSLIGKTMPFGGIKCKFESCQLNFNLYINKYNLTHLTFLIFQIWFFFNIKQKEKIILFQRSLKNKIWINLAYYKIINFEDNVTQW